MHYASLIRRVSSAALLSLIAPASPAQSLLGCDINDQSCLERMAENQCVLEGATTGSCLAFVEAVEQRLEESYTVSLGSTLAMANLLLADANEPGATVSATNSAYIEAARTAYEEIVERDPANADALLGLANIARLDGSEDPIARLRSAATASQSPFHMRLLANALRNEVGGFEGELESAQIYEKLYDREEVGPAKWALAENVWVQLTALEMAYPERVIRPLSPPFADTVRDDANLNAALQELQVPESSPQEVSDALELICLGPIAGIFGFDDCIDGIESSVTAALTATDDSDRDALISAAVNGIKSAANWRLPFARPDWQGVFNDWIDRLLISGIEDANILVELHVTRADYAGNSPARIDALSSALEIDPDSADLNLKLGTAYLDQRMWQEAREYLNIARTLAPTEDHANIDRFLRIAEDQLIN